MFIKTFTIATYVAGIACLFSGYFWHGIGFALAGIIVGMVVFE